jgi:WXG100 family type VII secretion target
VEQLRVDFPVLRATADSLAAHIDDTETKLGELEQTAEQLAATWSGDGHQAFHDTIREWLTAVRDLHEELERIRHFVVTTHNNHAHAVHTNTRFWRV